MSADVRRTVAAGAAVALAAVALAARSSGRWPFVVCVVVIGAVSFWVLARPRAGDLSHGWTNVLPFTALPPDDSRFSCATAEEFLIALELGGMAGEGVWSVVHAAVADDAGLSAVEIYLGPGPAGPSRTTIALLWLHPVTAYSAVQRRGGGLVGVLACLRAAGSRLQRVPAAGARLLSSEELACLMPPEHRTRVVMRPGEVESATTERWLRAAVGQPECRSLVVDIDRADGSPVFDHAASARSAR